MAVASLLVLGACKADGRGYEGEPFPGGPVGIYDGTANFGFNFTCHMDRADRAVIKGNITYHDSAASTVGDSRVSGNQCTATWTRLGRRRRHVRGGGRGLPECGPV